MIRTVEGAVIRDKVGPLREGANLTLVCTVEKGSLAISTLGLCESSRIVAP